MEELIALVSQKAGISADQAKTAVQAVLDFAKTKLPAPVAAQLEGLLQGDVSQNLGGLTKGLTGLLGR